MLDSKKAREAEAQKRLKSDWPDFPEMQEAIAEYESLASPEARFVYAFDKLMPMITVYLNDGITWREREMALERLDEEKTQKMKVAPEVYKYWTELRKMLIAKPELFTR
jgi:hypothetical protein